MKQIINPFILKGYLSEEYFCDRVEESETLINNIKSGADSTIISPRKYGKTGLILHVFDTIKRKMPSVDTLYIDIFSALNLDDMIKIMAENILEQFPPKTSLGKKFVTFLKGLRTKVSLDSFSGMPQVEFNFLSQEERNYNLRQLLEFINGQEKRMVVAIDEFQQIEEFPEKNVEALLRTYTQQLHNISFIFCGSKRRSMAQIFTDAKRPFFSSTRIISLDKIDAEQYASFIKANFDKGKLSITDDAVSMILDWTKLHTFYTQSLCNELYGKQIRKVTVEQVRETCIDILERETPNFLQLRELLTQQQWRLLIGVAKENEVESVATTKFLTKYNIGSATNARRALQSLVDKELILESISLKAKSYSIYNVFFSRWLAMKY